ncbi:hypothetical protein ATANTOWER_021271 [Ataeniobius toweri]|uniref:Secreted protein n=1 Tax=Ataeniobius toweri TaxID=208326 RepID=A0ABU7CCM0_9TELE|nr:hypothetical protein [Ataeniobius toweri]
MNRLHTPILFLVLFQRVSWMNHLHTPILFLVLFQRGPKPRSSWRTCLHFLFLSLRSARTHPLCMLGLGGSAADLNALAEGPSGLCTDRLGSSGFRTAAQSFTVGSPGPAAGCQIKTNVWDHERPLP